MNKDAVQHWLKRKKATDAVRNSLLALAALVAGLVVLFATFWLAYAAIWVGWQGIAAITELLFSRRFSFPHGGRLVGSGVFTVLLFLQYFRTDPWHWGEYPKRKYPGPVGLVLGLGALLVYPGAASNMTADILLNGPRLIAGAAALGRQAGAWLRMDAVNCAVLLAFLARSSHAVTYDVLRAGGWADWMDQLRHLDRVVFLEQGLTLSSDLKQELLTLGAS